MRSIGILSALLLVVGIDSSQAQEPADRIWLDVDEQEAPALSSGVERLIVPQLYRTVWVDWDRLDPVLERAPMELSPEALLVETVLTLPLPDGTFGRFRVEDSPIMETALAARLPEVKTYRGVGLDDPSAFGRFDTTPAGFHGMILSDSGIVFIDPYARGERDLYVVYDTRDYLLPAEEMPVCQVGTREGELLSRREAFEPTARPMTQPPSVTSNGGTFREVHLAVAANGEYTQHFGGVANAQAQIVTTINRVNVVYENYLAIRHVLVDNTSVVFPDPSTDPYPRVCNDNPRTGTVCTSDADCVGIGDGTCRPAPDCSNAVLDINQATLDSQVGAANYDLGHVVGAGGSGGLAGIGPCLSVTAPVSHGKGCTSLNNPTGDPFDIDFVAHEIGHQWGAPHTFNGNVGSCSGGNRASTSAYEPGSGSTIMAYAGICGTDNLQANSDDYFHGSSLETIAGYDPTTYGDPDCIGTLASGNTPPTADAGADYTIPKNTPFELCGTGTDPDPTSTLTYLWEELDVGPDPGGPANNPLSPPFFRSFEPLASNCRTFPKLSDILSNTQTNGEILPDVGVAMTFRLTVFDNDSFGVGGGFAQDESLVTVTDLAGPFRVWSPNGGENLLGGELDALFWDVAGTDGAGVDCSAVDLMLSIDGGTTFPLMLLAATPNDGFEAIEVPNLMTSTARLKVRCTDNVFFDISDNDFAIQPAAVAEESYICAGGATTSTLTVNGIYNPPVAMSASGLPAGTTATFVPDPVPGPLPMDTVFTISDTGSVPFGSHVITVTGEDAQMVTFELLDLTLNVFTATPSAPGLTLPPDGAVDVAGRPTFEWTASTQGQEYTLEVDDDPAFGSPDYSATVVGMTTHTALFDLARGTTFFWRVRSTNPCGAGSSTSSTFTTGFDIDTTMGGNIPWLICAFGKPNHATYGQTFTVNPGETLKNLTFFVGHVFPGRDERQIKFSAYLMEWDGEKATGPILFESAPQFLPGDPAPGIVEFVFDTGGITLPVTQYVAFLSASNYFDELPAEANTCVGGAGDAYSGGDFHYLNNGAVFSEVTSRAWFSRPPDDLAFRATFERPDLEAIDVYFRDQPGDLGNVVSNPAKGQNVFPHLRYSVSAPGSLTGTITAIELDGTSLCTSSATIDPGVWVISCSDPWTATAGSHQLRGIVDPNNEFSESNEENNQIAEIYDVGCVVDADCDNGLFCDGTESCDVAGECQAGTPVACDDGVGCTSDACNEATDSCDNGSDDALCDNGLFCDGAETCDAVNDCQAGSDPCVGWPFCDESIDSCVVCFVDADCDNGDSCDGLETCNTGVCQPGTPPPDVLSHTAIVGPVTHQACGKLTIGPSVTISGGPIVLRAGGAVVFVGPVTVEAGADLEVENGPSVP